MKSRIIVGILFMFSGLVAFVAGGVVLMQTLDRQASTSEQVRRAEISCREQVVRLGRVVPRENDQIEIQIEGEGEDGIEDPRIALANATAAVAMCPGREIVAACIGTTCGTDAPGPISHDGDIGAGEMNLNRVVSGLDWLVALAAFFYGAVMVVLEWPEPSIWSWVALVVGVAGIPLALFNPMRRLQSWMLRRMVKR